ncbi:AMP-binding protein [Phytohabitans kaempferiae]|uniref:AMP-binding protein n=1 Tax=Phytohabitans kaempferiae TaxID=1620943 RepID=A0ABV6MI33_9ACTN
MSTPLRRSLDLLADYQAAGACAAQILCDRHDPTARAFTVINDDLTSEDLTYGQLRAESTAVAGSLARLGVGPGDRVATLAGKSRPYLVTVMAIWRLGAVHVPLFTAFAPAAIAERLAASRAKVVVCDTRQRPKLTQGRGITGAYPSHVVVIRDADDALDPADLDFAELATFANSADPTAAVGGDAPMVQIYTSGTTGRPKAVAIPVKALATWQTYLEYGLDVTDDDVFWCAADPGWTYGLYVALAGPLAAGRRSLVVRPQFNPATTWSVLARFGITNFAAAPTIYRALRGLPTIPERPRLALRRASSAGEPLTPEVNQWAPDAIGVPVHDHFGQTEAGMLLCNHHHADLARPLRPGSMGHPAPGWSAAVLYEDRDQPAPPGTVGRIAFNLADSPMAWFTGYLDEPDKTAEKFTADGRWYLTGDTGSCDDDGYFRFHARDDDVIIMAGYRIGPFDVESVLSSHSAVAECAVIAAPDRMRGEVIEAYVVLAGGTDPSPDLATELQQWVKDGYGAHAHPRTVHFVPDLPKTLSGKLRRNVLRDQRRAELAEVNG